jgi:Uma2 family endonuclease
MEMLATPRARRWTRAEYDRLIDLGVFEPGERLELIDGVLMVREPQGSRHAAGIRRVLAALRRALGDAWQIDSQLPIALDEASEVEPDVAVVPSAWTFDPWPVSVIAKQPSNRPPTASAR